MRWLICLCCLVLPLCHVNAQALRFSATGCGPYADDEEPLLERYIDMVNKDDQSAFLVHLGDVVSGSKRRWPEEQYTKVANILKQSRKPTFVVLGDNEWNDLDNPQEGLQFWNSNFLNFDKQFPDPDLLQPQRQTVRPENFAFASKGVLIVGINLVGGRVHDRNEWATRMQQDVDWIGEQFELHKNDVRAAVILAQAKPSADLEPFFQPFAQLCTTWKKPVLYLHADGHVWQLEKGWKAENLWRVQTDQVRLNPPVLVTVTDQPGEEPFVFDRRLDIASRRELFVDDYLIERLERADLRMHKPQADDVAITCDQPWEGNTSAYFTIFQDDKLFRMYYRAVTSTKRPKNQLTQNSSAMQRVPMV